MCSVGVLTDENARWRPVEFSQGAWGSSGSLRFPVIKLLDYADRDDGLSEDSNVFGVVVRSHLAALSTRGSMDRRFSEKLTLVRHLYDRGMDAQDVRALARFMDWVMTLPPDLELQYESEVRQIEEANRMPYLMDMERRALDRGREEGREEGRQQQARDMLMTLLQRQFGALSDDQKAVVQALTEAQAVDTGLRLLGARSLSDLGL